MDEDDLYLEEDKLRKEKKKMKKKKKEEEEEEEEGEMKIVDEDEEEKGNDDDDDDDDEEERRERERFLYGYRMENTMGMTITSGSVTLDKNDSNLIGISIGGGAKYCPCLYVVQVFDNTAASNEGTLQSGDEITAVNNINVKGKSKQEVAHLIQRSQGSVTIQYNKLHAEPKQGKTLDIAMKKVKHRLVENLSSSTADALGLSRAILCNDSLVKKLDDLQRTQDMYQALMDHTKRLLKAFFDLAIVYKRFGDVFCEIGVRELQQSANEAFNQFGDAHRQMEKYGIQMLKRLKPILSDLGTYLHKAIPDTRLTITRYADAKFEYLSYCLKVKEMDDEELQFAQLQEPLYRVETGNYEYRLVLRCRQEARSKFAKLRSDVLVKLELLDSKHAQHLTEQLTRLIEGLASYHSQCQELMHGKHWFPIELDMVGTTLNANINDGIQTGEYEDEEEEDEELIDAETGLEARETQDLVGPLADLTLNTNSSLNSSAPHTNSHTKEERKGNFEEILARSISFEVRFDLRGVMAALLQWRKFSFFDVKASVDGGKLAEAVKDASITCACGGRGRVYAGDSVGCVHSLTRQLRISTFTAHSPYPITAITALDNAPILITVADGAENEASEVKVWAPDKSDDGMPSQPRLLRTIRPDPRPANQTQGKHGAFKIPKVTAIAVHPNLSLLALGFSDGAIMLYRGEVSRERGSKPKVVVTVTSGVTSLHLRHTPRATHLFLTTHTHTYCINASLRDKETTIELDALGCAPGCATLADGRHDHHFLVARPDAIYSYTSDSRGSCYVFEGDKSVVGWFRGYLLVAATERAPMNNEGTERTITIYDLTNKLVALSTKVRGLAGVVGEWGGLYLIASHPSPSLIQLAEKDLHTKFQLLFRKNQFDTAISLAKTQCCDPEEVAEILRQYGDWLYSKGNHAAAMDQYLSTLPHLEPSYVIKKYLDTQHIHLLTSYLEGLHQGGWAGSDHTSLLLNCYTRLRDTTQLHNFITTKGGSVDCDVEAGVRVCRAAGYLDHALTLSASHGLHSHHLSILTQDKQDYTAALRYIATLELDDAQQNMLQYGSVLLNHNPEETTDLLVRLCTDYKPTNSPVIKEGSLDGYLSPDEPECADPEVFEYLVCGQGEHCVAFLEKVWSHTTTLTPRLLTALLAEYLHLYGLAPEGQEQAALGERIMEVLRSSDHQYSRHHALLLCDKHQFHQGKLLLWEQSGMFEEMVQWYGERGEWENAVGVCTRKSPTVPRLWCVLLRQLAASSAPQPPDQQHLTTCLANIKEKNLMPALEVVEVLSGSAHMTLGDVREYLLGVVGTFTTCLSSEATKTQQNMTQTAAMKDKITNLRTSATQFTATKCNICNYELELPSVHFLCQHSFHHHCFESYSESDAECPVCLPDNRKMLEVIQAQETHRSQHDQFHEQLERSSDSFSVLADYLGRGVFTSLRTLHTLYPSLNTTKDEPRSAVVGEAGVKMGRDVPDNRTNAWNKSVPDADDRLRGLERSNQGPVGVGGEGRLRLGERKAQGILERESESRIRSEGRGGGASQYKQRSTSPKAQSEGRVRQEKPSAVLTSPTEAQLRSSMANITQSIPVSGGKGIGGRAAGSTGSGERAAGSTGSGERPIGSTSSAGKMVGRTNAGGKDALVSGKFSPSLHDHITHTPPSEHPSRTSSQSPDAISAALSATHISTPKKQSDNPFGEERPGSAEGNPFSEDFETETLDQNPFADDYDEAKNPFADDDVESPSKNSDDNNPFKDDYDSALNPFGES